MKAGILYNVQTVTGKGKFVEHSLLSSVTTIEKELEEIGYDVQLYESYEGLKQLCIEPNQVSFVINYFPLTRTNQNICCPSVLNFYHIPFVGNESAALVLCADKILTKFLARTNQIPIPRFFPFSAIGIDHSTYDMIAHFCKVPFVLKANRTSGSLGVRLIQNKHQFFVEVDELTMLWGDCLFAEEYIDGIDITVPVLTTGRVPKALGTAQYLDKDCNTISFFSHNRKYHEKITCSNYFDEELMHPILLYAAKLHQLCGCTSLSRVDFRISKEREIFLLEINATPELNHNGAFSIAGEGRQLSEVLQCSIDEALHNSIQQQ